MVCSIPFTLDTFSDLLVWPTGCDYYFYLKIFLAIFFILTWGLYIAEKKIRQNAEFISCIGVSSLVILILALIGTLIKNSADIPMIATDILLSILAFTIPIVLIWIFKR